MPVKGELLSVQGAARGAAQHHEGRQHRSAKVRRSPVRYVVEHSVNEKDGRPWTRSPLSEKYSV